MPSVRWAARVPPELEESVSQRRTQGRTLDPEVAVSAGAGTEESTVWIAAGDHQVPGMLALPTTSAALARPGGTDAAPPPEQPLRELRAVRQAGVDPGQPRHRLAAIDLALNYPAGSTTRPPPWTACGPTTVSIPPGRPCWVRPGAGDRGHPTRGGRSGRMVGRGVQRLRPGT